MDGGVPTIGGEDYLGGPRYRDCSVLGSIPGSPIT